VGTRLGVLGLGLKVDLLGFAEESLFTRANVRLIARSTVEPLLFLDRLRMKGAGDSYGLGAPYMLEFA